MKRQIESARSSRLTVSVFILSRDRALQLEGTLRSLKRHCSDLDRSRVDVLVSASSDSHRAAYKAVASEHPDICFWEERRFDRDVRALLGCTSRLKRLQLRFRPQSGHPLFQLLVVDDTLFVRDFSLGAIGAAIAAESEALGFSLRLGETIRYCQPLGIESLPPPLRHVIGDGADEIVSAQWVGLQPDWGYPLELSSSFYRRDELAALLRRVAFDSPTTLEHALWRQTDSVAARSPNLLCFRRPRAFSLTLNRVQTTAANPVSGHKRHDVEELLDRFLTGWRIDVAAYDGYVPHACHEEVELLLFRPSERASAA